MILSIIIAFILFSIFIHIGIRDKNKQVKEEQYIIKLEAQRVHKLYFDGKIDRENYAIILRNLKRKHDTKEYIF